MHVVGFEGQVEVEDQRLVFGAHALFVLLIEVHVHFQHWHDGSFDQSGFDYLLARVEVGFDVFQSSDVYILVGIFIVE